jgi:Elongation complex protein 6
VLDDCNVLIMFADLNNFMEIDLNRLPKGNRILVIEKAPSNGSFVLCHLLSLYLRGGHNVCLVGLAQTFNHYNCIANKLSLNLQNLRESGHFQFVEALKFMGSDILSQCDSDPASSRPGE